MSSKTKLFPCQHCSKSCPSAEALKKHKQREHRDMIDTTYHDKTIFACPICGKDNFSKQRDLTNHIPGCEDRKNNKKKKEEMKAPMPKRPTTKADRGKEEPSN